MAVSAVGWLESGWARLPVLLDALHGVSAVGSRLNCLCLHALDQIHFQLRGLKMVRTGLLPVHVLSCLLLLGCAFSSLWAPLALLIREIHNLSRGCDLWGGGSAL